MPSVMTRKIAVYGPPPLTISGGCLGPATGAVVVKAALGIVAAVPQTVTRVVLLPTEIIALDADSTTFVVRTSAGVTIASGTNAAAIPLAGLVLTLVGAAVNLAVGTVLHLIITNVVDGQALQTVQVGVQVELQPT